VVGLFINEESMMPSPPEESALMALVRVADVYIGRDPSLSRSQALECAVRDYPHLAEAAEREAA
jgi:hypothetical protein